MSNEYPVHPPARALLLGTFHFADKGRDIYKPQYHFDVAARQREIEGVVKRLAAFAPTKVAVEFDALRQTELDNAYEAYRRNDFELTEHETHQLGFRLAKGLQLPQVHALNAWGRFYDPPVDVDFAEATGADIPSVDFFSGPEAYARDHGQTEILSEMDAYLAHFAKLDSAKAQQPLQRTLRDYNEPQHVQFLHGAYLVAHFKAGHGHLYPGPDAITAWYNRNLRIFANLQRITEPGDRIVIIYGAGHTSILRHCLEASPEYDLVEVSDYL